MQAGLDTTAKDKSAGIDQFEKDVQSDIKELTDDLTKLKVSKTSLSFGYNCFQRENTARFKQSDIYSNTEMEDVDIELATKNRSQPAGDALKYISSEQIKRKQQAKERFKLLVRLIFR